MKLSGKMRNKLPFVLPCGDDSHLSRDSLSPFLSDESSLGTMHLSNDNLAHMNEIYKKEIPQVQSLWTIYQMEKEVARKKGNLKKFPKFTNWRPEGSQAISDVHLSILEGLQPTAVVYHQFLLDDKQHSRSYLYISTQHPRKRPTIVFYSPPSSSEASSCSASRSLRFGVVDQIYQHTFSQKSFMWAAVSFYRKAEFIPSCGLWCSEDSIGQTVPVLLSHLSHPLTTAVDENLKIWFLDVYY